MVDRDALHALAELLAAATGPDRKLDGAIFVSTHEGYSLGQNHDGGTVILNTNGARASLSAVLPYTDSIDAALALVGRLLPGWDWDIEKNQGVHYALLLMMPPPQDESGIFGADAPTTALAILRALVAALIAQGDE